MAKPPRSWLRSNIDKLLVPALEQRGFARARLSAADARSEMAFLTPHGSFRRRGSQGIETIEIHFDRYDRAVFGITFGTVPPGGVSYSHAGGSGHVAPKDLPVAALEVSYSLLPRPRPWGEFYLWRWPGEFRVRRWPGRTVVEPDYQKLVAKAVGLIPEIERVFKDGRCGPHVRVADKRPNRLQRFLQRLIDGRSGS